MLFKREPIIIIGMHRSGTSLLSRYLSMNSVFMGSNLEVNYESIPFLNFNDSLLDANSCKWFTPKRIENSKRQFDYFTFLKHFNKGKDLVSLTQNLLVKNWGWKDPRNTFTLRYWLKYFPNAKILHVYRNGVDSIYSLHKRNERMLINNPYKIKDLTPEFGIKLWEKYVTEALRYSKFRNYLDLRYETLGEGNSMGKIEDTFNLEFNIPMSNIFKEKSKSIDSDNEFYYELCDLASKSEVMKKLDYNL